VTGKLFHCSPLLRELWQSMEVVQFCGCSHRHDLDSAVHQRSHLGLFRRGHDVAADVCQCSVAIGTLYLFLRAGPRLSRVCGDMLLDVFRKLVTTSTYCCATANIHDLVAKYIRRVRVVCCCGMMWNLEWRPNRGVILAFMEGEWRKRRRKPVLSAFSVTLLHS